MKTLEELMQGIHAVAYVVSDSEGEQLMYPAAIFKYKMASEDDIVESLYTADAIAKVVQPLLDEIERLVKLLADCRNAAGFGTSNDPMNSFGWDALGDEGSVPLFIENQFATISQQLADCETRVVEACAKFVSPSYEHRTDPSGYLGGQGGLALLLNVTEAIRSGEWRKYLGETK